VLELSPLLIPVGYLAYFSFQLARIDVLEHRLPNRYTLRLFLLSVPAVLTAFFVTQSGERLLWAMGLGFGTALLGLLLGATGGLGLGDVKLMVSLNMILGWLSPWAALASNVLAVFSAAFVGMLRLLKHSHSNQVAFGPYLLAAFFITFGYLLVTRAY
jgi:leader peptidase (prepilin peptidase)/N-methyltransferase